MNGLSLHFSIYWPFATSTMQRRFAYKVAFFSRMLGGLIQIVILASLWGAIFQSSGQTTLRGFTEVGILTYVVMSWLTVQITSGNVEWTVAFEIRQGQVAVNLVRPVSYFSRLVAESFGTIAINFLSIVVPAWLILQVWLVWGLGAPLPSGASVGLYLVSVLLAFSLSFLINFLFALSAFWVTYVWGFLMLKQAIVGLMTGELIPLAFFPDGWAQVLPWLPFAGMNSTPVSLYLGTLSPESAAQALLIQTFWVVLLWLVVRVAWRGAVRRLAVLGG